MKKIDTEKSVIYRFNKLSELTKCVLLLGEKGYFSDFENFSDYKYGTLTEVTVGYSAKEIYPFRRGENEADTGVYSYFIPESRVVFKEEEEEPKKLRSFKSTWEFEQVTGCSIGDVITIHRIDNRFEESCIVNGYKYCLNVDPSIVYIVLGADKYTLEQLLQYFKYAKDGEWLPFGVEE